jgi:hypothetical protein
MKLSSATIVGGGRLIAMLAAITCCGMMTSMARAALIDYSDDLAADFTATYPGGIQQPTGDMAPVGNPFGAWALHGSDHTTASLVPVGSGAFGPGLPASGQAGWNNTTNFGGPWTYFAQQFQPGVNINGPNGPRMNGHGPQEILWTAPANVDAGGVTITGQLEQEFQNNREMRLSIYKNGSATPLYFVNALPPIVDGVILQKVTIGPIDVAVNPGDTLKFSLAPSGNPNLDQGNVPTFAAWDVQLNEKAVVPEPATIVSLAVAAALLVLHKLR